jgi:hypothetical protein
VNHLAYPRRGVASVVALSALALASLGTLGCTAGVRPSASGSGGSGTGQGGSSGTGGGTGGRVVITGEGGSGSGEVSMGTGGMISPDGGCMTDQLMHTPTLPTVMILVDRSGSEFDSATTGVFFNLRPAVEQVVMNLQGMVRFGIASFVGDHASGSCMLDYEQVAPDLNNYTNIQNAYESWGPLMPYGAKADTPMSAAIPMVKATLQADTTNGPKYMMLVTDSETDFCDDGNALCPADAITYEVQDLYNQTPSIGTLVIGVPDVSSPNQIEPQVLKNLANAGVGQGVGIPTGSGASTTMDFWYQCNGSMTTGMAWQNLFTAAGRTGMTSLATYTTVGTASAYTPTDTSTTNLATQIQTAVNTIPVSCVLDLSTLKNPIKVDRTKPDELATAGVYVNGQAVQFDPNNMNGWDMISDNELELFGPACTAYQMATGNINLQFPCDLVIIIDQP